MPNLDHDPKNPTDLLGRPIQAGDIVAWGTTYGRSAALAICEIERIRFIRRESGESWGKNIECTQAEAIDYQLVLQPIKSTGSTSVPEKYHPDGYMDPETGTLARHPNGHLKHFEPLADKPKLKTVQLVKNVVKLEPMT